MKEYIDKEQARQLMKAYRKSLTPDQAACMSKSISNNVINSGIIAAHVRCILSFASYGTEPDTKVLDESIRLSDNNIMIAYPKVLSDRENMEFYAIHNYNCMTPGYMNIPEPDGNEKSVIPNEKGKFVMIVPGLAFDMAGARAGYGGGFYDRYLERYPDIIKAAICYDRQLIKDKYINKDEHDIMMDYIITDKRVVEIKEDI